MDIIDASGTPCGTPPCLTGKSRAVTQSHEACVDIGGIPDALASRAARILVASAEVQDVKHVLARLLHAVGMQYIPPTKYAGMRRAQ